MATRYDHITPEQKALIEGAPLFFVGTADPAGEGGPLGEGAVNISPKGDATLVVLDDHTVAYLDYVGSGNQTARHIAAGSPVTLMVCSFEEENAGIVRLYGKGKVHDMDDYPHRDRLQVEAVGEIALPERQIIEVVVDTTITSCGYGVPVASGFRSRTVKDRGRVYK